MKNAFENGSWNKCAGKVDLTDDYSDQFEISPRVFEGSVENELLITMLRNPVIGDEETNNLHKYYMIRTEQLREGERLSKYNLNTNTPLEP